MLKILVFLFLFLPALFNHSLSNSIENCNCPAVGNLQKTWQTSTSIGYNWSGPGNATGYKVWYTRQEGQFTSQFFYTTDPAFTFTGLSAGHYTFYFVAVCDETESSFIGSEDVVQG